jgi:glycosyltransferase involved in cell wall biosynthesis
MTSVFIIWGRELNHSRSLAAGFGAHPIQVYYKRLFGVRVPAAVQYILQTLVTIFWLLRYRPKIVYVQNPPIFAPLVCYGYCRLFRAKLAIDTHTAAFLDSKWIRFHFLFKWLGKRVDLNTCHNFKNLEILKSWGVEPSFVMQLTNPTYDMAAVEQELSDQKLAQAVAAAKLPVLMVNRFASDDDYLNVFEAAKLLPEATFFVTGDPREYGLKLGELPNNVHLTGYLPHPEFLKLMYRSNVVLSLTMRPDTILWSVREAMALGRIPVISDTEVLRHYYGEVGLFAKYDPADLAAKIRQAASYGSTSEYQAKVKTFLEQDKARWADDIARVHKIMQAK